MRSRRVIHINNDENEFEKSYTYKLRFECFWEELDA